MRLFDRYRPLLFTPAALLVVAACATSSADPPPPVPPGQSPDLPRVSLLPSPPDSVEEVVDGRTVVLSDGVRARVLGLAAPGECWSAAALRFARDTLLGKLVRYSRASESAITLRLVNNADYATLAVNAGAMRAEKDDAVLAEAEKSAARAGLGLWGPPCNGQDTTPTPTLTPTPTPVKTTTPTIPPVKKNDCTVTYRVAREWQGGFHTEVIVRNTTQTPVTRWSLHWAFPAGQRITDTWNAAVHQHGPDVLAMSQDGAGSIGAGGHVSLRFNATTAGPNVAPNLFTLNGRSCSPG